MFKKDQSEIECNTHTHEKKKNEYVNRARLIRKNKSLGKIKTTAPTTNHKPVNLENINRKNKTSKKKKMLQRKSFKEFFFYLDTHKYTYTYTYMDACMS